MSNKRPTPYSLETMVDMAVQQVLSSKSTMDDPPERMMFTGVWNDAYPAILVRDPILPDSAKIQLLYLLQEVRLNPYAANPLPSVEKTSRDLGKSPTTVVRDRAIIRMTRWASQCRRVRDAQGKMRGLVWTLHGEPASLAEATTLDPEHMELLEQAAAGHFDRIARRAAQLVLTAIDHDIESGRDPLEPVSPIEQRLEALQTLKTGSGRYFSGYFAEVQDSNLETSDKVADGPISNFESSGAECQQPVSNFEISASRQHSNFETGDQPIDFYSASKFETGEGSSSSNIKTTTTAATYDQSTKDQIRNHSGHSADTGPSVTTLNKPTSSSKKQTSTTAATFDQSIKDQIRNHSGHSVDTGPSVTGIHALHWPTIFDDNRTRLVQRMLQHHLPNRPDDQQEVINALAAKLTDVADPIRNLGNYVTKLCKLARTGELCPVEPPSPPVGRSLPDEKLHISNLRGEIGSLQRLIAATEHTGSDNLQILEAQLVQRRAQLRELEQKQH
jgi:hypothetical protein